MHRFFITLGAILFVMGLVTLYTGSIFGTGYSIACTPGSSGCNTVSKYFNTQTTSTTYVGSDSKTTTTTSVYQCNVTCTGYTTQCSGSVCTTTTTNYVFQNTTITSTVTSPPGPGGTASTYVTTITQTCSSSANACTSTVFTYTTYAPLVAGFSLVIGGGLLFLGLMRVKAVKKHFG